MTSHAWIRTIMPLVFAMKIRAVMKKMNRRLFIVSNSYDRSENCALWVPSSVDARSNSRTANAADTPPLWGSFGLAANCQPAVVALVVSLLKLSSPSAIARFVVAVVIDALDFVARRRIAHICIERGEGSPAFTDCNAASAIVFVRLRVRVIASISHPRPNNIDLSAFHSVQSVRGPMFSPSATTGPYLSLTQFRASRHSFAPTLAGAAPKAFVRITPDSSPDNCKAIELLPSYVDQNVWHKANMNLIRPDYKEAA